MEAIATIASLSPSSSSSSSNAVVLHSNGARSLLPSSTESDLGRFQIGILPAKKTVTGGFLKHTISLKAYQSPLSQPEPSAQADLETPDSETQTQETDEENSCSVRVKFVLQKECLFGEQFLLVGNHPVLGLWDPEYGVPLDWSDGHVWAVELDMPMGESIQYKFILKGIHGQLLWQPDPDRVLSPWETRRSIVVLEDWENPLGQKITAEEKQEQTSQGVLVKEEPVTDEEEPTNLDDSGLQVEAATLALQETETVSDIMKEDESITKEEKQEQTSQDVLVKEEPVTDEEEPTNLDDYGLQVKAATLALLEAETDFDTMEEDESITKEEPAVDEQDSLPDADSSLHVAAENLAVQESEPVSISATEESFSVANVCAATQLEKPTASIMADAIISRTGSGQVSSESMNSDQKVETGLPLSDDNVEDGDESSDGLSLVPEEARLAVLVPQETPSEEEASEDEGSVIAIDASDGEVDDIQDPNGEEKKAIAIEYDEEEVNGEGTVDLLPKEVDNDERAPAVMNSRTSTDSGNGILVPEEERAAVLVPGLLLPVLETPSEEATEGERSFMAAFDESVEGVDNDYVENPSGEEKAIAVECVKEEAHGEETAKLLAEEKEVEEEKPDDDPVGQIVTSASEESRWKCSTPIGEADNVLRNDMQWVQKLLSNLGLL